MNQREDKLKSTIEIMSRYRSFPFCHSVVTASEGERNSDVRPSVCLLLFIHLATRRGMMRTSHVVLGINKCFVRTVATVVIEGWQQLPRKGKSKQRRLQYRIPYYLTYLDECPRQMMIVQLQLTTNKNVKKYIVVLEDAFSRESPSTMVAIARDEWCRGPWESCSTMLPILNYPLVHKSTGTVSYRFEFGGGPVARRR